MNFPNYTWTTLDIGEYITVAVLNGPFDRETRYNLESLNMALDNVTKGRNGYASEEAWRHQLEKFQEGKQVLLSALSRKNYNSIKQEIRWENEHGS